mmetsp:Transcript_26883/g.74098  ORF Transcript_26883/g.74098 Transcript_26883/m.74098 type:complete len:137 (-) Transcript_26883:1390-1800(-)
MQAKRFGLILFRAFRKRRNQKSLACNVAAFVRERVPGGSGVRTSSADAIAKAAVRHSNVLALAMDENAIRTFVNVTTVLIHQANRHRDRSAETTTSSCNEAWKLSLVAPQSQTLGGVVSQKEQLPRENSSGSTLGK